MRRTALFLGVLAVLTGAPFSSPAAAQGPRLPPHRFFGKVTLSGGNAPVGTVVEAYIGGTLCGSGQANSNAQYVVDVDHSSSRPGCGTDGATITFRVAGLVAAPTATFRQGGFEVLDLTAPAPAAGFTMSVLNLADPRPCIPEPGERRCNPLRESLWNGEAAAWAARGVTDPDARFNETVVFRVRAGDPAAISNIARFLAAPFLQVTRITFVGTAPGQTDEYVEMTNLGGGEQDMTGWSVRSPLHNQRAVFPDGFVMQPSQSCRIYTGMPRENSCGNASFNATDVWPDDHGQVVLYYDALDLLGHDTLYAADPDNQPPPPHLQGVN